jgi:peptidoglycan L-alanyl-D-glutamate endopeptidase CwlK
MYLAQTHRLRLVDPRLCACAYFAQAHFPHQLSVISGRRSEAQQRALVDAGKSPTMNSRHLTGDAVDLAIIVDGKADWEFSKYAQLNTVMQLAARSFGFELEWGGSWKSRDGVHWQIPVNLGPSISPQKKPRTTEGTDVAVSSDNTARPDGSHLLDDALEAIFEALDFLER